MGIKVMKFEITIKLPDRPLNFQTQGELLYTLEALRDMKLDDVIQKQVQKLLDRHLYTEELQLEMKAKEYRIIWTDEAARKDPGAIQDGQPRPKE